jgi:hypothetical protein
LEEDAPVMPLHDHLLSPLEQHRELCNDQIFAKKYMLQLEHLTMTEEMFNPEQSRFQKMKLRSYRQLCRKRPPDPVITGNIPTP